MELQKLNRWKYLLLFLLFIPSLSHGQDNPGAKADTSFINPPPPQNIAANLPEIPVGTPNSTGNSQDSNGLPTISTRSPITSFEFLLSMAILAFGVITLIFINVFKNKLKSHLIYKAILLTLIITCSIILVVAGYTNQQITAASGILGGISGYLIGRQDDKSDKEAKQE